MCFAFFGCCGPSTITMFNANTGSRVRRKLRETSASVNFDDRVLPWGPDDIVIWGREQPSATATNEGSLMLRNKDTLQVGTLSVSTPLSAQVANNGGQFSTTRMFGDSSTGVWVWRSGQGIDFFNASLVQQWKFATATGSGIVRSGTDVILTKSGVSGASTLIEKINSSGASSATLAPSALSVTVGYTVGTCNAIPIGDSGDILVYGRETHATLPTNRRLWVVDSSLTETAANSPTASATAYAAIAAGYNNFQFVPPDLSSAVLRTSTQQFRIDLATLTEAWAVTVGNVVKCCDDTHVYTLESDNPTARLWTNGTVAWTKTLPANDDDYDNMKIAEETGDLICVCFNSFGASAAIPGVLVLDPSDGSTIHEWFNMVQAIVPNYCDVLNYNGAYYVTHREYEF